MGALASLAVIGIDRIVPGSNLASTAAGFVDGFDFHATLMDGMLSFLLFAGALHVNWTDMQRGRWPILVLSTVGVVLSTLLIGSGFFIVTGWLGLIVPLSWCLVFGALISPTDPVAVMSALRTADVPPTLKATVAGESLFNDGVGVVIFTIILESALGGRSLLIRPRHSSFRYRSRGRHPTRPCHWLARFSRDALNRRIQC